MTYTADESSTVQELYPPDRIKIATDDAKASKINNFHRSGHECTESVVGMRKQIMKDAKPRQGGLNSEIQSRIGHQLRAMYDDVVRQGVPDRFADLIKQLDGAPADTPKNGGRD